ncbi:MAG TPA: hydroxymethylbilane synthase, partial [Deltaproteobacteria bacterium]|nr:hydroxymethylbilane synthase [Deltaproteobacteria bacterium]
MKTIRIGTRGSKLALAQAEIVISLMKNIKADLDIEIQEIHTTGDRLVDVSLDEIGGKGLFVKDIEMHLLKGDIDVAVHSLKDMPTEIPEGLDLAAFVKRDDPRDML